MTLSETIELIEAALNEAPICEYPDFTNAVREVLARARQAEALKREIADLREALKPFATHIEEMKFDVDNNGVPLPDNQAVGWVYVTNGDFRRARALLSKESTDDQE